MDGADRRPRRISLPATRREGEGRRRRAYNSGAVEEAETESECPHSQSIRVGHPLHSSNGVQCQRHLTRSTIQTDETEEGRRQQQFPILLIHLVRSGSYLRTHGDGERVSIPTRTKASSLPCRDSTAWTSARGDSLSGKPNDFRKRVSLVASVK